MRETLHINYDGNTMTFLEEGCYESRGKSTIAMVIDAFESMDENSRSSIKPFSVFFYVGDKNHYPFSYSSKEYNKRTIPCHVFHQWKECGVSDYDTVCNEMQAKGLSTPKDERLFWIGNVATHPTRRLFLDVAKTRNDVCAIDSGNWHGSVGVMKQTENKYISLPDHCDYKYLIDVQGNGYSGRAKILFHSNRPVFYQDREWHEYWFFEMKPFVHYIPIKEDFSDLNEKLNWANAHPEECARIAQTALEFAKTNLRRENAIQRYQDILMMLGED
jgi:hypothetical protein